MKHTIVISPICDMDATLLSEISAKVRDVFGYPTETMNLLDNLDFAFDALRKQYHSTAILERLADLAPKHAVKVLAISEVDLFIPIFTHVYGEAQLGGKACIASIHRLKEGASSRNNPGSCRSRILKETIHEIGHTFGLLHCQDEACIMHYCRTVEDVDRKSNRLCRYCEILLKDEMKRQARR